MFLIFQTYTYFFDVWFGPIFFFFFLNFRYLTFMPLPSSKILKLSFTVFIVAEMGFPTEEHSFLLLNPKDVDSQNKTFLQVSMVYF